MNKISNLAAENIPAPMRPSIRTGEGLRDALFDEIDALRDGTGNPTKAIAVAKLACQIVNIIKVEVEYQRHLRAMRPGEDNPAQLETVRFGRDVDG